LCYIVWYGSKRRKGIKIGDPYIMATKPSVDVDEEVSDKVKAEVQADPGLSKLYATWQAREAANNKQYVSIVEYVRDNKISRIVVKKTLEARGLTPSSVSSEVSRIMGLCKDDNRPVLEQLMGDEITVAAARKAISKRQSRPAKSNIDKLWERLILAARIAVVASGSDPTFTVKYFLQEAQNAWNSAQEEQQEKERQAAGGEEVEEGEEEGEEDVVEPVHA
jgi:hypothetical protein